MPWLIFFVYEVGLLRVVKIILPAESLGLKIQFLKAFKILAKMISAIAMPLPYLKIRSFFQ